VKAEVWATALGLMLILVAAAALDPHFDPGWTMCPFKTGSGLPCPGCGLTHSFVFMAHGRVADAFRANALGPVLFALAAWLLWRHLLVLAGKAETVCGSATARRVGVGLLIVLALWWPLRLYLGI
jgi:hypothetical protein